MAMRDRSLPDDNHERAEARAFCVGAAVPLGLRSGVRRGRERRRMGTGGEIHGEREAEPHRTVKQEAGVTKWP